MIADLFVPAFQKPVGSPIRELFPYLSKEGIISFAGGYPSPSLFDAQGLAAAAAQVFAEPASSLQYGPTEGNALLRDELLKLCMDRGTACKPEELLVTSGAQQGFDLLVRVLVDPGDVVLIETPAYPAAIQSLRLAGATILEVPLDSDGLRTDSLEILLARLPPDTRPKLLYTVPSFSNPRGTLLSLQRRHALIALARRYGFVIIEDDPYGELVFHAEPLPSVYGLASADRAAINPVIYLSSLSKTVAPGLRVGWMTASAEIVRRCAIAKQTADLCSSPITQMIAAKYLQSGRYPVGVINARQEYRRRMQAMASALRAVLGSQLRFDEPGGGMFLWADCPTGIDPRRLFESAVDEGVLFVPGAAFYPGKPPAVSMRLSFAAPSVEDIHEGVARLARAVHSSIATLNTSVSV